MRGRVLEFSSEYNKIAKNNTRPPKNFSNEKQILMPNLLQFLHICAIIMRREKMKRGYIYETT